MDAKVVWSSGMSFSGTSNSGFAVPLDTDPSVGGTNNGFKPLELMAVSLAGCTAMDVISILRKKQQDITGFEVLVSADQRTDHPHVFTQAVITYRVTGRKVDEAALLRAIELSATKYCPAQSMLAKSFPMKFNYEIYESVKENLAPIKRGEWKSK
jgi:putative redox protein